MRALLALVLVPALALAQQTPADCAQHPDDASCRRPRTVYVPGGGASVPAPSSSPVPVPRVAPAGDAPIKTVPNLGGIGNAGEAALLVAVIALAVLPIIIYSVDAAGEPELVDRWGRVSGEVRLLGGGVWTPPEVNAPGFLAGTFGARAAVGWKVLGADASFRVLPDTGLQWDAHLLLRVKPKAHVQGALALGYRNVSFLGSSVGGFEAALPHEYVFWRNGPMQRFGLELRPAIVVGPPSVDLRIDGAFVVPIYGPLTGRVGGNVYSFGHEVRGGFEAGLVAEF